ncbi:hypothetical protein [Nocardioides pantholopis]|uniref:hypothetical protein n=1 Tax=Nocardioides pantholopis TaxID=2483798 RepID=UPI000F075C0A|nr:hypothetical protein [Nocardioides pantholopis]
MRAVLSGLAGVLACLLLPVAIASTWTASVATDTDRYVDTVRPLAADEAVQRAVERRLTGRVLAAVDGTALGDRFGDTLGTVARSAVRRVLESPAFEDAWAEANRAAHEQVVRELEDDQDASRGMSISLAPVARAVLRELGVPAPATPVDVSIQVLDAEELDRASAAYRLVDRLGRVLPVVWVVLVVLALLLARRRMGALARLGVGSALTSLALIGAVWLLRGYLAGRAPALDQDVVEQVWWAATADLRTASLIAAAAGAVVALGAGLALAVGRRMTGRRDR